MKMAPSMQERLSVNYADPGEPHTDWLGGKIAFECLVSIATSAQEIKGHIETNIVTR